MNEKCRREQGHKGSNEEWTVPMHFLHFLHFRPFSGLSGIWTRNVLGPAINNPLDAALVNKPLTWSQRVTSDSHIFSLR